MSEKAQAQAEFNPADLFDPSTFSKGGGGWNDQKVLITGARFFWQDWKRKDGTIPENATAAVMLEIKGVAQVAESPERTELYSVGPSFEQSANGEYVIKKGSRTAETPNGVIQRLVVGSNAGKFFEALHNAGFPSAEKLVVGGQPKVSGLVGAVITFKGEEKKDKDGKAKTHSGEDGKEYKEYVYWPVAYLKGESYGAAPVITASSKPAEASAPGTTPTAQVAAQAAPPAASEDTLVAAQLFVLQAVAEANGKPIKRIALMGLAKDQPAAVKTLLLQDKFLKSIDGVKYDKGELSAA